MDQAITPALVALPLDPISPRLPVGEPFTPAAAARAGIGRSVLDRLLREGRIRRLLRGVYLDATVPVSVEVRARALALVVADRHVVAGTTAAWVHGVTGHGRNPDAPVSLEVADARTPRRGRARARGGPPPPPRPPWPRPVRRPRPATARGSALHDTAAHRARPRPGPLA